ncbi:MAG: cysteine desulfurase family protein [Calditrichaceae bacterium]
MKPIYLDYNATTPVDQKVAEAMLPFLTEHFGNPSSSHILGRTTKKAIENARIQIAEVLHCSAEEILFTSGGSESNNWAIKGVAFANSGKGNHIITSQIEHPAVIEVCHYLESNGFKITYLAVDEFGIINPQSVINAITNQTILISIMHVNNEVGSIQPIREISKIARQNNILMHSDCAQSIGKIPVFVNDLDVDLLSVAGHKLYAPKGIGALYIKSGVKLEKLIHGASQESNYRSGTENILGIVGLGKAFELINGNMKKSTAHLKRLRDRLENRLIEIFPSARINGHKERRLPNTSSICFKGIEANAILEELGDKVAVSAGAACHSHSVKISSVLEAMKVPMEYAMGTIRFSVGRFTKEEDIDKAIIEIKNIILKLSK